MGPDERFSGRILTEIFWNFILGSGQDLVSWVYVLTRYCRILTAYFFWFGPYRTKSSAGLSLYSVRQNWRKAMPGLEQEMVSKKMKTWSQKWIRNKPPYYWLILTESWLVQNQPVYGQDSALKPAAFSPVLGAATMPAVHQSSAIWKVQVS